MSWSTDTAKWIRLGSGNVSCTSVLDCFSFTQLHDKIGGFLNRMAIGAEVDRSLLELTSYCFCREHQKEQRQLHDNRRQIVAGTGPELHSSRGVNGLLISRQPNVGQILTQTALKQIALSPVPLITIDSTEHDSIERSIEP